MANPDELSVERHRRVLALFREARLLPRNERAAFVDRAAQGDTVIDNEVARRLAGWDRLNERRDLGLEFDANYELLKGLGRGGMGVVYLARQVRLDRLEAVKMIKLEHAADSEAVRMFLAEARAAAALRHAGIVQIYAVGAHLGQPAYAMEYIDDGTLQDRIHQGALAPRRAAELVARVAEAVHYAHQCGIVHRDLKPANILLDSAGLPKVADFGLARGPHDHQDLLSGVAGTPAYMSPEQVSLGPIGPAADIHALGGILYALLTGEPPFRGKDAAEVLEKVLHVQPSPPWRKGRRAPRGLQAICLRCLQKQPERRYPTAGDVASALTRWRARRRRLASLATAAALLLAVGYLAAATGLRGRDAANLRAESEHGERLKQERLVRQNKQAAAERDLAARRNRYAAAMKLAQEALESGDYGRVMRLLEEQRPPPGKEDLRGFEWHWLWRVCHRDWQLLGRHGSAVACVAWSSDGRTIVSGGEDGVVRLWDAETRKPLGQLAGHTGAIAAAMFSADGKLLATASADGTARLWHIPARKSVAELAGPGGPLGALALTADGQRLAVGVRDEHFPARICVWELSSRRRTDLPPADQPVHSLAFSPRGDLLAAGIGPCLMWNPPCDLLLYALDAATPAPPTRLAGHTAAVTSVAFSPDGGTLASGSRDYSVRCWDVAERRELRQAYCQGTGERRILSIALSPDGASLASVGIDAAVRIWDSAALIERCQMRGHRDVVRSVAWAPHGKAVVTAGDDGNVLLWSAAASPSTDAFQADDKQILGLAISPDSRTLATVGGNLNKPGDVRLWKLPLVAEAMPEVLERQQLRGHATAFSPDGRLLAVAGGDWNRPGQVDLWNVSTGAKQATLFLIDDATPEELREQKERRRFRTATCVAFSSDGRMIASGCGIWGDDMEPGLARIWNVADGQTRAILRGTPMVRAVAFSPRGDWLAAGGNDSSVGLYETRHRRRRAAIEVDKGHHALSLVFSPNGASLAVAVSAATESNKATHVHLYDVRTWRKIVTLEGHISLLYEVAFSPDGRRLATAAYDHTARIWDRATGHEVARYSLGDGGASVAFSRNGRYLAVGLFQGGVRLWDIGPAQASGAGRNEALTAPKAILAPRPGASVMQASESREAVNGRRNDESEREPAAEGSAGGVEESPAPSLVRSDPAPPPSFDRQAAEYVLSIGGTVILKVNDVDREIKAVAALPDAPFRLTTVVLDNNQQVTDEGLACFEGCQDLIYFNLGGSPVSDAGLAHFRGCKKLRGINLDGTKLTDAGMLYLKDCKDLHGVGLSHTQISDAGLEIFKRSEKLEHLYLGGTRITDAGLAHFCDSKNLLKHLFLPNTGVTDAGAAVFEGCENLLALDLSGTRVTDAGLANFKGCKQLLELTLSGEQVTDVGLAYFAHCHGLKFLYLSGTRASDVALSHFRACEHLERLTLDGTRVTDAGLTHLAAFPKLTYLALRNTHVTLASIEALRQALPGCKIAWSAVEP